MIEVEIEAAIGRYTLRIINPGLSNVLYSGPTAAALSPYTALVVQKSSLEPKHSLGSPAHGKAHGWI